jgi:hypothetical protein
MDATLVSPEIFPPSIKMTPNSPIVCAKVITMPVMMLDLIFGISILKKVSVLLLPRDYEASISVLSNA